MISNIDELYRDGFNDLRYKLFTMNKKKSQVMCLYVTPKVKQAGLCKPFTCNKEIELVLIHVFL